MMIPTVNSLLYPRELTREEQANLNRLSQLKFYDCNGRNTSSRPIIARALVPANHKGQPVVVLLCQITVPDQNRRFEYVIFSDHLDGGYPVDSFGSGTIEEAGDSFGEKIAGELFGHWPWVIQAHLRAIKSFVDTVKIDARSLRTLGAETSRIRSDRPNISAKPRSEPRRRPRKKRSR